MSLKNTYEKDLFQVNKKDAMESSEQLLLMYISLLLGKFVQSISNCYCNTLLHDFSCRFIVIFAIK